MKILDGKLAAQAVKEKLKIAVEKLKAEGKKVPHLAAILIGDNGASATYVAAKVKACEETGFISTLLRFDTSITATQLLEKITELNKNSAIDGILVQLPLPAHIAEEEVIKAIDPAKDVDGFHPLKQLARMPLL